MNHGSDEHDAASPFSSLIDNKKHINHFSS
jgi:hypothetical protein